MVTHVFPWCLRVALRGFCGMRIQVALTGPPRVLLGRSVVDLILPREHCTLEELFRALAEAEPRIARYFRREADPAPIPLRALLDERPLDPGSPIPDGATVTLLYAIVGG
jgi:hypothetical protein